MDSQRERVKALLDAAVRAQKENNLKLAERYLGIVLRLDPNNREALKLKEGLERPRRLPLLDLILFTTGFALLAILWLLAPGTGGLDFPKEPAFSEPPGAKGSLAYGMAMAALAEGDLPKALTFLEEAAKENPELPGLSDKLSSLYYKLGQEALDQGQKEEASSWFQKALAFSPDWKDPALALARLTPTPTPTPIPLPRKRIEVVISQQRLYAWEGETLVYKFVCSTGAPGSPTKPGSYSVISKIPMAYSYKWGLKMPYWLGIYRVGDLENGIHALPILPNGQTLWAGYLGKPVSFGCIILGTEEAKLLYDWAEIGTPVEIKP